MQVYTFDQKSVPLCSLFTLSNNRWLAEVVACWCGVAPSKLNANAFDINSFSTLLNLNSEIQQGFIQPISGDEIVQNRSGVTYVKKGEGKEVPMFLAFVLLYFAKV
jgi:hypothetical protein